MTEQSSERRILCTSNGLSSEGLMREMQNLLGAGTAGTKTCWYIPTAYIGEGGPPDGQAREIKQQVGFKQVLATDIAKVQGEELKRQVEELQPSCIYLELGNTYYLLHSLRASGADELILKAADEGVLIVGASAGSICLGETAQIGFWKGWDDRECMGIEDVWGDWEQARGLQLLGGRCIFPHAQGQYGDKAWQAAQSRKHGHDKMEVIPIKNGQGVVFVGDEEPRIVG